MILVDKKKSWGWGVAKKKGGRKWGRREGGKRGDGGRVSKGEGLGKGKGRGKGRGRQVR